MEILIAIVIILIVVYIFIFNQIVSAKQKTVEAWSDIDVQLHRRHDLIPNLVTVVGGYAKHEKELLEKVTHERSQAVALGKEDVVKLSKIESILQSDVRSILLLAENYPDLKANTQFMKLQDQLVETEDQIASSRRIYNSNVANYNTLITIFPHSVVASINKYLPASYFQSTAKTTS